MMTCSHQNRSKSNQRRMQETKHPQLKKRSLQERSLGNQKRSQWRSSRQHLEYLSKPSLRSLPNRKVPQWGGDEDSCELLLESLMHTEKMDEDDSNREEFSMLCFVILM